MKTKKPERTASRPGEIKRILVPVDFSDSSLHAVRYATRLAAELQSCLDVVHVIDADYGWLGIGKDVSAEQDAIRQKQAADYLRCWIPPKTMAKFQVRIGRPADEIVNAARECKADVILMSTHGRTGVDRILIGSVADHVVHLAPCPVFLIRADKSAHPQQVERPAVLRFESDGKSAHNLPNTNRPRITS